MHWRYRCIEDPTDGDDIISGDAMRDDRTTSEQLDSMLDKLDMAIENARDMLREDSD